MQVRVETARPEDIRTEAVVVPLLEESPPALTPALRALDARLDGLIARLLAGTQLRGRGDDADLVHTMGRIGAERLLLAGMGKAQDLDLKRLSDQAAKMARRLRKAGVVRAALCLPEMAVSRERSAKAAVEGLTLAASDFTRYRAEPNGPPPLEEIVLLALDDADRAALERGARTGQVVAEAMSLAREMGNEPGNVATPTHLANRAQEIATREGLLVKIIDQAEAERLGMGAFLSVARGSEEPAKIIILEWPGEPGAETLGFVGKGITFDSGGISLKPGEKMGYMKYDMLGGAAVMAALGALARLKARPRVVGIIPATENLPSGRATKPGDIVRSMAGLHIEVTNTDAEGRMVLADALTYARREYQPAVLVDIATLTGAIVVALGNQAIGLMGNDQALIDRVRDAGERCGERLWPLPLYREYLETMRSPHADLRNSGSRSGGAINAAAFLSRFTEGTPWVHLDIAGTAWIEAEDGGDRPYSGATGSGVRTLVELALT